jgi:hypothetical protein
MALSPGWSGLYTARRFVGTDSNGSGKRRGEVLSKRGRKEFKIDSPIDIEKMPTRRLVTGRPGFG